ncbi:MAG: hypothetical protein KIT84_23205 [Labilithrix sp.]|nr:hypothetical protein [Labilithrix sp.]MCW5813955.1 hypothetical protein [Labilithrix sp.]
MPNDRSHSLRVLASLKPAQVFLDAYTTTRLPQDLSLFFRAPEYFWSLTPPDDFTLVALLDDGGDEVVTFYDPATRAIVTKDLQDFENDFDRFASWNQFVGALMLRIAEGSVASANAPRIATLLGFPHLDRLLAFARSSNNDPATYDTERRLFLATL